MGGAISLLLSWLSDTVRTQNIPLRVSKNLHSHNGGVGREVTLRNGTQRGREG